MNRIYYAKRCVTVCPFNTFKVVTWSGSHTCYTQFPAGFFATMASCVPCSLECILCQGDALNCTECANNKFLSYNTNSSGQESALTLPRLGVCVEGCDEGYFPGDQLTCVSCEATECLDCYLGGAYCRPCDAGYSLELQHCVATCSRGLYNSRGVCRDACPPRCYGEISTGFCLPCFTPCTDCSNATHCLSCLQGKGLFVYIFLFYFCMCRSVCFGAFVCLL